MPVAQAQEDSKYLEQKRIPEIYNQLLQDLLKAKPKDANLWMMDWFERQIGVDGDAPAEGQRA